MPFQCVPIGRADLRTLRMCTPYTVEDHPTLPNELGVINVLTVDGIASKYVVWDSVAKCWQSLLGGKYASLQDVANSMSWSEQFRAEWLERAETAFSGYLDDVLGV